MSRRVVQPEQLDQLPHNDVVAQRIHRDIRRYNQLMGNFRWMANALRRGLRSGDRVLEIAAGRGQLIRALHRDGILRPAARVAAFDAACPRPEDCPESIEWSVAKAETFADYGSFNVIVCCHFLHQLEDAALATLGQAIGEADLLLATEPRRHWSASLLCRASALIGFSRAGIGDGLTSIRAGFQGCELPQLLGWDRPQRQFTTSESLLGRYTLAATKIEQKERICI